MDTKINISLKDGVAVACSCGGKNFMELTRFFKFSALLTGAAKDSLMPIPVYVCGQCGATLEELLPNDLKATKPKVDIKSIEIS